MIICIGFYDPQETLGKHHTFITRTADKLSLANSPSASKLLKKLATCCRGDQSAQAVLKDIVEAMDVLHVETVQVVREFGKAQKP